MLQTKAASTAVDSDTDDQEDFDQYSELDAFDTDEVEVSPDDEQALAAFMVSPDIASHGPWHRQQKLSSFGQTF